MVKKKVTKKTTDELIKENLEPTKKRKKTTSMKYTTVSNYFANVEYSQAFITTIANEIKDKYGADRAVSVLESLKKFHIHNKENFFEYYPLEPYRDLSMCAHEGNETDIVNFTAKVIELMNKRKARGEKDIDLTSFLFYTASVAKKEKDWKKRAISMKLFTSSLLTAKGTNPFRIGIIHKWLEERFLAAMGLDEKAWYWETVADFLTCLNDLYKRDTDIEYPKVYLVAPVREDQRASKLKYLARVFHVSYANTKKVFADVIDLTKPSAEVLTGLAQMQALSPLKVGELDYAGIVQFMAAMEKYNRLFAHTQPSTLFNYFEAAKNIPRPVIKRFNIKPVFYEEDGLLNQPFKEAVHIGIDCSDMKEIEKIKGYVHDAIAVMLLRIRDYSNKSTVIKKLYNTETLMRVTLENVKNYTVPFRTAVKELEREMQSYYNRPIKILTNYDYATATSKFGEPEKEFIRVISDIHTDINKDKNYIFDFGTDYVINCGDTSGDCETTRAWIKSYMRDGVVVAGNHMGYTMPHPEANGPHNIKGWASEIDPRNTKNGQVDYLCNCFKGGGVRFLSNGIIEFQGMIIIGTTLYTDFKLFGEKNQAACSMEAWRCMNDFRNTYYLYIKRDKHGKPDGFVKEYTPEYHIKQFNACLGYIRNRLRYLKDHKNNKPIIIVTHHIPVPYGVEDKYKNDPLSAAFASDLRWLIDDHPEIRLWCFGHTHHPCDFIYNRTRFVCEPWGYFNENDFKIETYGKRIRISDIKSKEYWTTILKKEIKMRRVKVYKKEEEQG